MGIIYWVSFIFFEYNDINFFKPLETFTIWVKYGTDILFNIFSILEYILCQIYYIFRLSVFQLIFTCNDRNSL